METNGPRTSRFGFLFFCLVLVAFGLYLFPLGVHAFRTGQPVRGMSLSKQYDWLEVLSLSVGSFFVGGLGIVSLIRERWR